MGAGSLIPLKQYDQFIQVANIVAKEIPDLNIVLVGNGPEEERLRLMIHELNLTNHITLTGKVTHAATLAMMQQSKILLHTSSYEGLGVVCLEALYAGAQVISFCQPIDRDIRGWHIVASKEEMVRKAIELLLAKKLEYTPELPFSLENTATSIMNLFTGQ